MMNESPILHIIVVGFHHKKGCQVEFSYPPLITGTEGKNECPSGWKYLPTLALPDGSHNFTEDSVFFNLPSLVNPTESIYGISCYRQIPVEKLKIRTADVTRSTVQKSVCILAHLPLYGYIEVKLSLIADAFFEQGDFSCTDILIKAYDQLNTCILNDPNPMRHLEVGLSLREFILKWRHKTLILFKLLMLQRRVVCFGSPVRSMCGLILVISSLYPKLLEKGFKEVACVRTSRPMSPMPDYSLVTENFDLDKTKIEITVNDNEYVKKYEFDSEPIQNEINDDLIATDSNEAKEQTFKKANHFINDSDKKQSNERDPLIRDSSIDTLSSAMFPLSSISPESWNAPLMIYSNGHLCLPFLSLPYMDLLTDPSVLSYIIGTSNILFHQKKNLADIQVDVENCTVDTTDQELKRQLMLTTEDLRFVDFIMRHVQNPKEDAEGSENWIREQFQGYILALLRTAVIPDNPKDCDHFNANFMTALKKTQCFQDWYNGKPEDSFFEGVPSGHPFAGTLSVADMKLKFAQTMHNTESGRKINQAVNTTSRAVGGALSQAKGAFTNWWSSITTTTATAATVSSSVANDNVTILQQQNNEILSSNREIQQKDDKIKLIKDIEEELINDTETELGKDLLDKTEKNEGGIVEIAKEAELLDKNHRVGDIFTI